MNEEIYTAYAPENDMTFILKDTMLDGEPIATEVIGFYYGEPDDELTAQFSGCLNAQYS